MQSALSTEPGSSWDSITDTDRHDHTCLSRVDCRVKQEMGDRAVPPASCPFFISPPSFQGPK